MIDGIPARVSVASSIILIAFLLLAYSCKYTAEPTPSGSTMIMVMNMM